MRGSTSIGSISKLKNKQNQNNNQQQNPYSIDKLSKIKPSVKIGFIKFWVAGAAFFLTFTAFQLDILDLLFALALLLTLAVHYIVNKAIIWMNNDKNPTLEYLPHYVPRKHFGGIFATMLYVFCIVTVSYYFIEIVMSWGIPSIGMLMFGFNQVGIDPITFGLVYLLLDYIYLLFKNKVFKILPKQRLDKDV